MTNEQSEDLFARARMHGARFDRHHRVCGRAFDLAIGLLALGGGACASLIMTGQWRYVGPVGIGALLASAPFYFRGRLSLRRSKVELDAIHALKTEYEKGVTSSPNTDRAHEP